MRKPHQSCEAHRPPEKVVVPQHCPSGWAVVALVLLLILGLWGWNLRGSSPSALYRVDAQPRPSIARSILDSDEGVAVLVYEAAASSVVGLTALHGDDDREDGAGVVWDRHGYVVTNAHLVEEADQILVRLHDGTTWPARRVGCDYSNDVAVVKIEAPPGLLRPMPLGRSDHLRIGQRVFAIGSPFGLDHTLTSGILSGLEREILSNSTHLPIYGVLQTDAAINPGNSGGPLLDSAGSMIGLNTAVAGPWGTSVGVGFAVPVETLNRVVPELLRTGWPERAGLGIRVHPHGPSNLRIQKLFGTQGVVVDDVHALSAADLAGLIPTRFTHEAQRNRVEGDLIHAVDGVEIASPADLRRALNSRQAGETVELAITRLQRDQRQELRLLVELQPLPPETPLRPTRG